MYFQCAEFHRTEQLPLVLSVKDGSYFHYRSRIMTTELPIQPLLFSKFPGGVVNLLNGYLGRTLSYDCDVLDTISELLNRTCIHLWGLPFPPFPVQNPQSRIQRFHPGNMALKSLLWSHVGTVGGLHVSRRPNFLPWSWVGWKNIREISIDSTYRNHKGTITPAKKEKADGRRFTFSKANRNMKMTSMNIRRLEPYLYISGWVIQIRINTREHNAATKYGSWYELRCEFPRWSTANTRDVYGNSEIANMNLRPVRGDTDSMIYYSTRNDSSSF